MNKALVCCAAALALFAGACSSSSSNDANFRVNLTDAPMTGVQAVNVTITAVRVHQSSGAASDAAGWRELPVTAAMPVDMLRIRGLLYELCTATLTPGNYQQVRLVVRQNAGDAPPFRNSVTTADGAVRPLEMPDDMKIVHSFTVADGTTTDLTLDLKVAESMRQRGNGEYFMQPVIGASSVMR